ncbi:cytidine deaminase [Bombilactobacillus bombi]|uniref:Cytidine deaminase n=1 Tax=Bombilactobacillus bombi TaxID=1303590 RepID=A0A417ZEY2_9LACO|nr:cytidine deaminase [Bombilactobacillus bombi]RHW49783.1 cytidine deaminase [Bombilactobacillus bombi]
MMIPEDLYQAATKMLTRAYVPYSHFPVGAALLTKTGEIYTGCNIENAAYGSTNCAERTAIFTAVAAGQRQFKALLITGKTTEVIVPCGACRQVISEFCADEMPVYLTNQTGKIKQTTVGQLLPGAFTAEDLTHE